MPYMGLNGVLKMEDLTVFAQSDLNFNQVVIQTMDLQEP